MKGIVFRLLEKMVTTKLGPGAWEALVDQSPLETPGGAFIGSETYPDADLMALVTTASRMTGRPAGDLVRSFGQFIFQDLANLHPMFIKPGMDARRFLLTVDRVIHVEVRKLHPGVLLPSFEYEEPAADRLVMIYRSPRQLCDLAAGLIDGVADHFGEGIEQHQPNCTKLGHDHCRFELVFRPTARS